MREVSLESEAHEISSQVRALDVSMTARLFFFVQRFSKATSLNPWGVASFSTCEEHRRMTSETETDSETIHEVGDVDSVLSERCFGGVCVCSFDMSRVSTGNHRELDNHLWAKLRHKCRATCRGTWFFFFEGGAREFESSYCGTHVR